MYWLRTIVRTLRPKFKRLFNDSVAIIYKFLNFRRPFKILLIQFYNNNNIKAYKAQLGCFFKLVAEVTKEELVLYTSI